MLVLSNSSRPLVSAACHIFRSYCIMLLPKPASVYVGVGCRMRPGRTTAGWSWGVSPERLGPVLVAPAWPDVMAGGSFSKDQ